MKEQVAGWGPWTALEMRFSSPNRQDHGLIKARQWAILKTLDKTFIQMNARDIICTYALKTLAFGVYKALPAQKMLFFSF